VKRNASLFAAWLAATIVSVLVASAAVAMVRENVSDEPAIGLQSLVAQTTVAADTTQIQPATTPPNTDPVKTPAIPTTTETSSPPETTLPTETTMADVSPGQLETFNSEGGSVSIEIHDDHLVFLGAVPAAGFGIAEKELESKKIEVKFRSDDATVKVTAKLEDEGFEWKTKVEDSED
jgi:hypothetical protein